LSAIHPARHAGAESGRDAGGVAHGAALRGSAIGAAADAAESHRATWRYLERALDAVDGFRPYSHLRASTGLTHLVDVTDQLGLLRRPVRAVSVRPTSGVVRTFSGRMRIRHLRVCRIGEDVLEGAAVVGLDEQRWALAMRMERSHGVWLCTHLEVL
jgi:hypothetical protein